MMIRSIRIASILILCVGSLGFSQIIYSANFESPTFTTGELVGQDGWATDMGMAYGERLVVAGGVDGLPAAPGGSQYVKLKRLLGGTRAHKEISATAIVDPFEFDITMAYQDIAAAGATGVVYLSDAVNFNGVIFGFNYVNGNVYLQYRNGNTFYTLDADPSTPEDDPAAPGTFYKFKVNVRPAQKIYGLAVYDMNGYLLDSVAQAYTRNSVGQFKIIRPMVDVGSSTIFIDDMNIFVPEDPVVPSMKYSDDIVLDGTLTEWAGGDWIALDKVYSGSPVDMPEAAYAVRWGAGGTKVYVAVKVRDIAHHFTDTYDAYNTRDAVEMYLHTTGTGLVDYRSTQADAQQYALGIMNSDQSQFWTALGAYAVTIPESADFDAAVSVDGQWLYYEAALTAYEFLDLTNENHIISPLHAGDTIGFDVTAFGHNGTAYTGVLANNLMGNKYKDYSMFASHNLVRAGVQGTITLQDLAGSSLGMTATIDICDALENVIETKSVVLDGLGAYSFVTHLRGDYTLIVSVDGYESASQPVNITGGNDVVNFTLSQTSNQIAGDANGDGMVDVGDLGILAANYGGSGKTWEQGDFNGDGLVDVGDLGILAANYGTGVNGSVDFNADYAKAFGTMAEDDSDEANSTSICGALGLPLIAGLLLMGIVMIRLEE